MTEQGEKDEEQQIITMPVWIQLVGLQFAALRVFPLLTYEDHLLVENFIWHTSSIFLNQRRRAPIQKGQLELLQNRSNNTHIRCNIMILWQTALEQQQCVIFPARHISLPQKTWFFLWWLWCTLKPELLESPLRATSVIEIIESDTETPAKEKDPPCQSDTRSNMNLM